MNDEQKKLSDALAYFDEFVNTVLRQQVEGVTALDTVRNYNIIRDELAKLLTVK